MKRSLKDKLESLVEAKRWRRVLESQTRQHSSEELEPWQRWVTLRVVEPGLFIRRRPQ